MLMSRPPIRRPKPRVGAPPKYPWANWLKPGTTHKLKKGKDFDCSTRSMIIYLYQRATKDGLHVSVTDIGNNTLNLETHR